MSVVTIGELQLGVLATGDSDLRARRPDTLARARTADPRPISEPVIVAWARLVADCRSAGVHRTVRLTGALIAATAVEYGLPVITQDERFAKIARAHRPLEVILV